MLLHLLSLFPNQNEHFQQNYFHSILNFSKKKHFMKHTEFAKCALPPSSIWKCLLADRYGLPIGDYSQTVHKICMDTSALPLNSGVIVTLLSRVSGVCQQEEMADCLKFLCTVCQQSFIGRL